MRLEVTGSWNVAGKRILQDTSSWKELKSGSGTGGYRLQIVEKWFWKYRLQVAEERLWNFKLQVVEEWLWSWRLRVAETWVWSWRWKVKT